MARVTYSQEAIEQARRLYCKYGGQNHALIERDMHRAGWPGWKKSILYDKGKDKNARMGWITRHGFERSLEIYTEKLVEKVNDDEQDLYLGIKKMREHFQTRLSGAEFTKDEAYQYRDFCKLEIEARRNLDLTRDNFETFVSGYEKLLQWLGEIDPAAVKVLISNGEKLTEIAQAHYGKQGLNSESEQIDGEETTSNDRTVHRQNEGSERSGTVVDFKRGG